MWSVCGVSSGEEGGGGLSSEPGPSVRLSFITGTVQLAHQPRDTVSHPVSSDACDAKDTATAGPSPRGKTPQREPTDGARLPG